MHVVQVRAGRPASSAASASPGAGWPGKRSWTGRGRRGGHRDHRLAGGSPRRAMTRTADRPTADSETCRNAVRAVSAAAGRSTRVSSSPGASALRAVAGHQVRDRQRADAAVRPGDRGDPVERGGQRGHRAGRQRQADVPADRGHVLHLERAEQRVAALPGEVRRRGAGRPRGPPARELAPACRSRRCSARRRSPSAAASRRRAGRAAGAAEAGAGRTARCRRRARRRRRARSRRGPARSR